MWISIRRANFNVFPLLAGLILMALSAIAGEDGVTTSPDDRILFAGGGTDVFSPGGEPSFPSSSEVPQSRQPFPYRPNSMRCFHED